VLPGEVSFVQTIPAMSLLTDNLTSSEISLPDHIVTVCGYLNHYRAFSLKLSIRERADLSNKFYEYLTSVCWKKNHQWINCWATIGLIMQLAWAASGATESHVAEEILGKLQLTSDFRLARCLKELASNSLL
jgi:hypothetical protein